MRMKKLLLTSLITVSASLPFYAHAEVSSPATHDLTLVNNTNQDSTSVIQHGACSSLLPSGKGITKHNSTNVVDGLTINLACHFRTMCVADVYMTDDCSESGASPIAEVNFNTVTGDMTVDMTDYGKSQGYSITGNNFTITTNGGPTIAKNN